MISLQYIEEAVAYDPLTGIFTWRITRPEGHFKSASSYKIYMTRNAGKRAGSPMKGGYISLFLGGKCLLAHRVAFAVHHGIEMKDLPREIDHRDTITSHNWIENLRPASRNGNMHNLGKAKNNTSGFKGVSWNKSGNKWVAGIRLNGKRIHLGYFNDPEVAHAAYARAANDKFGEFARIA